MNTVDQAVKAHLGQLTKAVAVTLPYSIGIGVSKNKPRTRDAVLAALQQLQSAGVEKMLLAKWSLGAGSAEAPKIVSG